MLLYIPKMVSDKKRKSSLLNTENHNLMISYLMKPDLFGVSNHTYKNLFCERAEIGKQTGLKILRVVTPLWVQVPPLAPKKNCNETTYSFFNYNLGRKSNLF